MGSGRTKLVVAGNFQQAEHWARDLGLFQKREWKYVVNRSSVEGLPHGTEIHFVGEWWKHPVNMNPEFKRAILTLISEGRLVKVQHE